jgi:hypothetical protein
MMNYRTLIILSCLLMVVFLGVASKTKELSAKNSPPSAAKQSSSLLFIENVGQFHESVRFSVMGASQPLWLTDDGLSLTFLGEDITLDKESVSNAVSIRLQFIGRSQAMRLEPFMPLEATVSYYRGNDPTSFHAGVPVWGGVRYVELYPGVDLEMTSQEGRLVQRLVGSKRLSESPMPRLRVEGAQIKRISQEENTLHLSSPLGPFSLQLPTSSMAWQVEGHSVEDKQMTINMRARLSLPQVAQKREQAAAGDALLYSTYIGGTLLDEGKSITTDQNGDLYVVGHIQSITFPVTLELYPLQHNIDAYIVKFDATSGELDYVSIFLPIGLDDEDFARDVVVDESGQAYITGLTNSPDFPTTEGAFDTTHGGGFDAFVLKVDQDGTLIYSTFLGSTGTDNGEAIAIDSAGNAYITGGTWSSDFPTTLDGYDTTHNGDRDIFLTKLNTAGSALEYSTFIGGSSQEQTESMILDDTNVAYLTGWTRSNDLPTTDGAYDSTLDGNFDAFVLKMDLTSAAPEYLTYLGGEDEDRGLGIALDESGEAIVAGSTKSEAFLATEGAYDTTYGGGTCSFARCADGFVAKLAPNGTSLSYATYLGGSTGDQANDITMGLGGHVYVIGTTDSQDFPLTADAYDTTLEEDGQDAFIAAFDASGTDLTYSSYFGGSDEDEGLGIARYGLSQVYLTGKTLSEDFPTSDNAYDNSITENGDFDIFAAILELPTPPVTLTPTNTPASSPTPSPTPTATTAVSQTPTSSVSQTSTTTVSQTPTATPEASMSATPTASASPIATITLTAIASPTPTMIATTSTLKRDLFLPLIIR